MGKVSPQQSAEIARRALKMESVTSLVNAYKLNRTTILTHCYLHGVNPSRLRREKRFGKNK